MALDAPGSVPTLILKLVAPKVSAQNMELLALPRLLVGVTEQSLAVGVTLRP